MRPRRLAQRADDRRIARSPGHSRILASVEEAARDPLESAAACRQQHTAQVARLDFRAVGREPADARRLRDDVGPVERLLPVERGR